MKKAYFIDGYHGGKEGHMPEGTFKDIVEFIEKHPDWHINLDVEAVSWALLKYRDPQTFYRLKEIIESPDSPIEIVGESISQPYCSVVGGEAIIRNYVYGREETKKHFNVKVRSFATQEPCQTSCLPQIFKSLGYERASMTCSTIFAGYTPKTVDTDVVTWVGNDGTKIDAVPRYSVLQPHDMGGWWAFESMFMHPDIIEKCLEKGIKNPLGCHIQDLGGMTEFGAREGAGKIDLPFDEYLQNVTFGEYFEIVKGEEKPEVSGQETFCVSLNWGDKALHDLTKNCRHFENALLTAEKADAVLSLYTGENNAEKIKECWQHLMMMEHHDAYSCVRISLGEKMAKHKFALNIAMDNLAFSQKENSFDDSGKELAFSVFNPLGRRAKRTVEFSVPQGFGDETFDVYKGDEKLKSDYIVEKHVDDYMEHSMGKVAFVDELPALSFATYRLVKNDGKNQTQKIASLLGSELVFENDCVKVVVDLAHGGAIRSYYDKKSGVEHVKAGSYFNELKGYFIKEEKFRSTTENSASAKILQNGEFLAVAMVKTKISDVPVDFVYSLRSGACLEVKTVVHFNEEEPCLVGDPYVMHVNDSHRSFYDTGYALNAYFDTAYDQSTLKKECAFDVCTSGFEENRYCDLKDLKHNTILHFADVSNGENGVCVLTNATTSYTQEKNKPFGMVLAVGMNSGISIFQKSNLTGTIVYDYAIYPHGKASDGDLLQFSEEYNSKPVVVLGKPGKEIKSVVSLLTDGVEATSLFFEGGNYYVRLFNVGDGKKVSFELCDEFSSVTPCNVDKTVCGEKIVAENGVITDFLHHYGIKTYRLDKE